MPCQILIVSDNQDLIARCQEIEGLEFAYVGAVEDALATLALPGPYSVVLVDAELPDIDVGRFFKQVAETSSAVPILTVDEQSVSETLNTANGLSIFRLLPQPCDPDLLETVFFDATRQFKLINRERKLRKKVQQLSSTDPLTGCCTRTVLQERLPVELRRSIRYNHYLSIIFCDVDQLGAINETRGHRVGDRILTGVAQSALEIFRKDVDWITRWGEDEFLIVLPETPVRGAGIVAERLRQAVDKLTIESEGTSARATISVGVTGYAPEAPDWNNTIESLLLVAGNCLKQAQSSGGNRVLVCP
ncbi:MAG TPA: diguanylate cyclase [Desulfobulbus sp.]|nr:diguanylate cyclase [Desulfobulbus sp.]